KAEIAAAFGLSPQAQALRKQELLETLRPAFPEARPFSAWQAQAGEGARDGAGEGVYQVAITAWCERLRLMFFGNLHQGWSEFVLADLGIHRYEQVAFSSASRGFSCRQDVDDYLHLQRCRERFDQGD